MRLLRDAPRGRGGDVVSRLECWSEEAASREHVSTALVRGGMGICLAVGGGGWGSERRADDGGAEKREGDDGGTHVE